MGKLQEKLATGKLEDYEEVKKNSAGLVKELLHEIGLVRGAKKQVADRLGIAASALSNVIAGKRNIPDAALKKLMAELQKEAKKNEPVEKRLTSDSTTSELHSD